MVETTLPVGLERRREDLPLITGTAHYVDDIRLEGRPTPLFMAVIRSPYAHAEIKKVDVSAALTVPGVVAAFAAAELVEKLPDMPAFPVPGLKKPSRKPFAMDRTRYVGDPVAVVLAESRCAATDGRDAVQVEYNPLPAVADPETAAASDAPLLYPEYGNNVAFVYDSGGGDIEQVFKQAAHTVRLRLVNQRLAPSSLEPRACLFDFNAETGEMRAWLSSQAIFRVPDLLANLLGLPRQNIRVQNAEVGGGFGAKTGFVGEEIVAALLAHRLARPVKWLEGRSENLQAQTQGRGMISYIEAAVSQDGRVLGLRVNSLADIGGWIFNTSAMVPTGSSTMYAGPYTIEAIQSRVVGMFTNKVPLGAYRGAGRPEAAYILERTMDRVAQELNLDPAEVRRRNFIPPQAFPYKAPTGVRYDSGNYDLALRRALELGDYSTWRQHQRQQTSGSSKLLGIGLSTYLEISGGVGSMPGGLEETATVRVRSDGTILVQSGVATNGQGHVTAFAQLAAEAFHLPGSKVEVQMGDTALPAFGIGTFGSRTTPVAAIAVHLAAEATRQKAQQLAARLLEVDPADLVLEEGKFGVRGVPSRSIELGELARLVEAQPDLIETDTPNPYNGVAIEGLASRRGFNPASPTFPSGAHLAVVEVDTESGEVTILKYVAVDDSGRILNSYLADTQIHGGLAQGIGQALFEEAVYDETGQLLSGTLMDYALPTAEQLPTFITDFVETPSPVNPLGVKGVGESGTTGGPPAIVNAVLDALSPLGITALDMPLRPEKIWRQAQLARSGQLSLSTSSLPPVFNRTDSSSTTKSQTLVFE